ncbi:MAG TPA: hypothetical protein DHW82_02205 [Spirochaetia bacterium]|nr:MAG: hypothetical protein A2Y41_07055 [Spirochaetes bacterium GWB1_36_13]HCL55807.1 hypothetical protein [Spirochaetia bacterium]
MEIEIKPEDYEIIIEKPTFIGILLSKITVFSEKYGGWKAITGLSVFFYLFIFLLPMPQMSFAISLPSGYEVLTLWGSNVALFISSFFPYDYYRWITANFLHFGIFHLGFNVWGAYVLGGLLEKFWNKRVVFILFLLSGIGANIVSFLIVKGNSAGASGGVFGLMGALLAFFLWNKNLAPQNRLYMMKQIGFIFLLNLLLGLIVPNIDLSGHIGGFVMGFLLGGLYQKASGKLYFERFLTPLWIFCIFLVASAAFWATFNFIVRFYL